MGRMAATTCISLHSPANLYKAERNSAALAMSECYHSRNAAIKLRRRSFIAIVSSKSPKSSDIINAKEVNRTYLGDKSPLKGQKSSEILTDASVDTHRHAYLLGKFVDGSVYRQTFIIRSYETGPDKTATMETLMNLLQVGYFYCCFIRKKKKELSSNLQHR
ncbi:hypothetical protein PanWU01x14_028710 [Parasponia andersonii]|uniref:Uncharacterized protein n=1 Tax=Parasponia andersonii TaxID=3476 RepID=A0A2P5DVD8_PARAD|nr:hypothetical protein PanWU01x14_028710 [Parasponia andersonii]